jgi:two-component system chemotaxis sensor kinase CheA
MDSMAAIKQTFFQECEEQLSDLERGLLRIEDGDQDSETVNAVFRAVHSIKGGASAFGFDDLVEFVHVFETTLDLLRAQKLTPTQTVVDVLLKSSDILADLVHATREGETIDRTAIAAMSVALIALCEGPGGPPSNADPARNDDDILDETFTPLTISLEAIFDSDDGGQTEPRIFEVRFKPFASLYAKANESLRLVRLLRELGESRVECDTEAVPYLTELDPEGAYFAWVVLLETRATEAQIREIFEFVEWDCELSVAALDDRQGLKETSNADGAGQVAAALGPAAVERAASARVAEPPQATKRATNAAEQRRSEDGGVTHQATIRVDLEKVDRLINLVGELVINQAVLTQRVSEAGLSRATSVKIGLDELEQLTRDIQDSVMSIRAQPVQPIFQRLSRVVREVAALTKKSVRLVTDGERTEVDKTVIERLTDPLTHMIRNAVDHGIESPEARAAAGKPEEGAIRLSAMHRSGRIVIEVADDGAGIKRSRVREIAVTKGLIPHDAALSEEEIDNLIFMPGFSTVDTASAISGRGVGMDVVKRAIQGLGGRISISSRPGQGSVFSMSLPLTLAVLDGMVVTVAGQTFVVPLTAVIETLQPSAETVHTLGGGLRVIRNRDSFVPLIDVADVLARRGVERDPSAQVALLTESESGAKCALLVDAIQGQRQVVIKSLETNYGRVRGVAAATILGDGRVALIVDVDGVIGSLRPEVSTIEQPLAAAE